LTDTVTLTSLHKVLWPSTGFTKGDLVSYYKHVAPVILPHISGRPLTLGRFPDGVEGRGFAQTECRGSPAWLRTAAVRLRNGRIRRFCLANGPAALMWIANLVTIELHTFPGSTSGLEHPAGVLFDLDPEPPADFADACRTALAVRARLAADGLSAVAKTTGGSGLHVVVPLNSLHTFERTRTYARTIARELAASEPCVTASASARQDRAGSVLIDWAQNSERRTSIAPYSLRANLVPLVATPVTWDEVERAARREERLLFEPQHVLARIERLGDPFAPALAKVQRLPDA
jgi:bifunctional non-homologous end joining protein LigD